MRVAATVSTSEARPVGKDCWDWQPNCMHAAGLPTPAGSAGGTGFGRRPPSPQRKTLDLHLLGAAVAFAS